MVIFLGVCLCVRVCEKPQVKLYQEDEWGVPNQSDGSGELALVSSAVSPGRLVCILGQLQLL